MVTATKGREMLKMLGFAVGVMIYLGGPGGGVFKVKIYILY